MEFLFYLVHRNFRLDGQTRTGPQLLAKTRCQLDDLKKTQVESLVVESQGGRDLVASNGYQVVQELVIFHRQRIYVHLKQLFQSAIMHIYCHANYK